MQKPILKVLVQKAALKINKPSLEGKWNSLKPNFHRLLSVINMTCADALPKLLSITFERSPGSKLLTHARMMEALGEKTSNTFVHICPKSGPNIEQCTYLTSSLGPFRWIMLRELQIHPIKVNWHWIWQPELGKDIIDSQTSFLEALLTTEWIQVQHSHAFRLNTRHCLIVYKCE